MDNIPSPFPVCTKIWAPNFSSVIKAEAKLLQEEAIQHNQLRLKSSHSKFEKSTNDEFLGLVQPQGGALRHPAVDNLLQHATTGCPVDCNKD